MSQSQVVFNAQHKVIGHIFYDTFKQTYDNDDILNTENAKGMDYAVYLNLVNKCRWWTITHRQTKMHLTMPFAKIRIVGKLKDMGAIYGKQILVPLDQFNCDLPAVQKPMI